ncbi:MAG TPA: diguanylate cyclase [Azospirillaceae bacterium]|nr:diguanylate cyclase [Azospirillaceae bacterium]
MESSPEPLVDSTPRTPPDVAGAGLRQLTAVARRLGEGDLGIAVPFTDHNDALGDMARAVAGLQQRLQDAAEEARGRRQLTAVEEELSPDGILVIGPGERVGSWNRRFAALWAPPDGLLYAGAPAAPLLQAAAAGVRHRPTFLRPLTGDVPEDGTVTHDEVALKDGRTFERHARIILDVAGSIVGRVAFFRDITARKRMEDQLQVLMQAVEHSPVAIMVTDAAGLIEYVNPKFAENTGFSPAEAIGHSPSILKSGLTPPETYRELWTTIRSARIWQGELYNRKKDGSYIWARTYIAPVRGGGGTIVHFVSVQEDITARKEEEMRIWRQAHFDQLTGLPNRTLFDDRLLQELNRARRHHRVLAVMFVDLDRFKQVNDTMGHEAGDRLLEQVAERLKSCVRETDTVSRMGGDEFVILLADLARIGEAAEVCRRILADLGCPFDLGMDRTACIGVSIGVSLFPRDGDNPANLLKSADVAMYWSKSSGRNTFRFFSTTPHDLLDDL